MTPEGEILAWLDANAQRRELRRLEREMGEAERALLGAAHAFASKVPADADPIRGDAYALVDRLMVAARAYAAAEEAWQAAPDPDAPKDTPVAEVIDGLIAENVPPKFRGNT